MGHLKPVYEGTMELKRLSTRSCMKLPGYLSGTPAYIYPTFKMSRYLEKNQLVNLDRKCDSYVSGVLHGVPV